MEQERKEQPACPECGNDKLERKNTIETGNIFKLNTKFSDAFKLTYRAEDGTEKPVYMGCYGFGPSRTMGTLVEIFNDQKGIIWPEAVAPFKYHLINLSKDDKVKKKAGDIYKELSRKYEVLYDDRANVSPGEKLAEADLIGIPYRLVVSDKTGNKIEIKERNKTKVSLKNLTDL